MTRICSSPTWAAWSTPPRTCHNAPPTPRAAGPPQSPAAGTPAHLPHRAPLPAVAAGQTLPRPGLVAGLAQLSERQQWQRLQLVGAQHGSCPAVAVAVLVVACHPAACAAARAACRLRAATRLAPPPQAAASGAAAAAAAAVQPVLVPAPLEQAAVAQLGWAAQLEPHSLTAAWLLPPQQGLPRAPLLPPLRPCQQAAHLGGAGAAWPPCGARSGWAACPAPTGWIHAVRFAQRKCAALQVTPACHAEQAGHAA